MRLVILIGLTITLGYSARSVHASQAHALARMRVETSIRLTTAAQGAPKQTAVLCNKAGTAYQEVHRFSRGARQGQREAVCVEGARLDLQSTSETVVIP